MPQYTVYLTKPAGTVYREFSQRVKVSLSKGEFDAPCITAFQELDSILETITSQPINDEHRLSGVLGRLFRVGGKWVRVCYTLDTEYHNIIIISIMHEIVGDPDPREVFATCAEILRSKEHRLRRLLDLAEPQINNTSIQ